MSRKRSRGKKKRRNQGASKPCASPAAEAAAIARLLEQGEAREAVRRTQVLRERERTPPTEALLGQAYLARLGGLGGQLGAEAETMLELASRRCPAVRQQIDDLRPLLDARFGRDAGTLLALLARPLSWYYATPGCEEPPESGVAGVRSHSQAAPRVCQDLPVRDETWAAS